MTRRHNATGRSTGESSQYRWVMKSALQSLDATTRGTYHETAFYEVGPRSNSRCPSNSATETDHLQVSRLAPEFIPAKSALDAATTARARGARHG